MLSKIRYHLQGATFSFMVSRILCCMNYSVTSTGWFGLRMSYTVKHQNGQLGQCWRHSLFEPTCAYARWAHMHRILSVTWPKLRLDKKSLDKKWFRTTWIFRFCKEYPWYIDHLQANSTPCWHIPVKLLEMFNDIGRWAHFNVKLHFFLVFNEALCNKTLHYFPE